MRTVDQKNLHIGLILRYKTKVDILYGTLQYKHGQSTMKLYIIANRQIFINDCDARIFDFRFPDIQQCYYNRLLLLGHNLVEPWSVVLHQMRCRLQ